MRVQLSSCVSSWDVKFCQVPNTSYLDIVWRLHKVSALDGTIRNQTSAIARLRIDRSIVSWYHEVSLK
jgi:hypothetical protein